MKERPILFSGSMVRAILTDTKSQTRRVFAPRGQGFIDCCCGGGSARWKAEGDRWHCGICGGGARLTSRDVEYLRCPYGQPGDRLWVRETWAYGIHAMAAKRDEDGPFVYAADGTTQGRLCGRWRPSIHMPRVASRITLEITDVRVQRLQDISEADAWTEGVQCDSAIDYRSARTEDGQELHSHAVDLYRALWESINGPGSWDANPWTWAITFNPVKDTPCSKT